MVRVNKCLLCKGNSSFYAQSMASSRYFFRFLVLHVKANLPAIVFAVTLFVVYYYLTLETDSCVAYADQFDQNGQIDGSNSGSSSRGQRSHRKMRVRGSLSLSSELLLAGLGIVLLGVLLYNYNGTLFFEPHVPKKK